MQRLPTFPHGQLFRQSRESQTVQISGQEQRRLADRYCPLDRDKILFMTYFGTSTFTRMPFGLKNYPATFQSAINTVPSTMKNPLGLVSLEDIIAFSSTFKQNKSQICTDLSLLKDAEDTLHLAKSSLGHV